MVRTVLLLCICLALANCRADEVVTAFGGKPSSSIGITKVWYKYSQFESYITLGEYPLRSRVTKRQCFIKVYNDYDFMLKRNGDAIDGVLSARWEMFETAEEDHRWFDEHCGD
jgi:hypothetical protein